MPLTITDELITSDGTAHTARPIPGHPDAWQVTWLTSQIITRSGAVTAMVLAELTSRDLHPGHRYWPHIRGWAAELGLTTALAVALASEPPREKTTDREPAASPPDREATGP